MSRMEKPRISLVARCSRPAERWWSRSACRSGSMPCSASGMRSHRSKAAATPGPAVLLHRHQCRRHACPRSSARWTWGRVCSSPSDRWWRKSSTCRSSPSRLIMGDTATSVNQGGASGSTGIQLGGKQMRMAAAEARRVLVEMAAEKLGVPADALTVSDGVVQAKADAAKKVSYAELIGGRYFNVQLDWNKEIWQCPLRSGEGQAQGPEGAHHRRQADCARRHCTEGVRPAGLLHRRQAARDGARRMIRPPVAGATPVKVDESSITAFPARKVVWDNGFLGVVADKEWDAVKAAQSLKVEWSDDKAAVPKCRRALRAHPQAAGAQARGRGQGSRQRRRGVQERARVIEAEYEWPFQSHACMGPACAVVEIKDGNVTLLDRLAEAAFRPKRDCAHARHAEGEGARRSGWSGPAPTGAAMRMTLRWMPLYWPKPSASRYACSTRASRERDGTRRARRRSIAPARRSSDRAMSWPTSSPARASRAST